MFCFVDVCVSVCERMVIWNRCLSGFNAERMTSPMQVVKTSVFRVFWGEFLWDAV